VPTAAAIRAERERRRKTREADALARNAEAIRGRCSTLIGFVREFWSVLEPKAELRIGWAVEAIALHLEAVSDGRIQYLLINVPPGMMKSLLVAVYWPAWEWATKDSSRRYLSSSFSRANVIRDNAKMRRLIESDKFQQLFPHVRLDPSSNAKDKFENLDTGNREGRAFESMTGGRGDCLLAGAIIETDAGPIRIEDIVMRSITCNVLSYDSHSRKLVYRPVEAVARRHAGDFYRVHTARGIVVECTGDHRIHTSRGWVEARLLSRGDRLMRAVRNPNAEAGLRVEEGRSEGLRERLLRQILFHDAHERGGWQGGVLQRLWCAGAQGTAAVFRRLSGGREGPMARHHPEQNAVRAVRGVQPDVPADDAHAHQAVLLDRMLVGRPFPANEGDGEPRLAERSERAAIHEPVAAAVPANAPEDHRAGRGGVRRLRDGRGPLRSPHRHGRGEQCLAEPRDTLSVLPHRASRGGAWIGAEDLVAVVERVCQPAAVYDLQVAGTRCFFANGVLVHNCVLIDDPHSVKNAESDTVREGVVQTFREAIPDRLNDLTKSAIVVIMQRLHARDVAGTIIAEGYPYVHLNLPMEFESTREVGGVQVDARCVTHDDNGVELFRDPRTREGELLFPERFPPKEIDRLKRIKGSYAWAGQYQQRPTAREGGLFKRAWFAGKIIDRATLPPGVLSRSRAWDFAATEEAESDGDPDWTAGVRMARHGVDYYVEGIERDRISPGEVLRLVVSAAETDPRGTIVRLPFEPAAAGVFMANAYVEALAGYPVVMKRPAGSKVERALAASIQAEFGHIYLVNSGPPDEVGIDDWIVEFLDELTGFPKAAHDDQVDAFSDAFNQLALGTIVPFSSASAGPRETLAVLERDTRAGSRDMDEDEGFGSLSTSRGLAF
jgi:predicted phage terminase large subunit-like protein